METPKDLTPPPATESKSDDVKPQKPSSKEDRFAALRNIGGTVESHNPPQSNTQTETSTPWLHGAVEMPGEDGIVRIWRIGDYIEATGEYNIFANEGDREFSATVSGAKLEELKKPPPTVPVQGETIVAQAELNPALDALLEFKKKLEERKKNEPEPPLGIALQEDEERPRVPRFVEALGEKPKLPTEKEKQIATEGISGSWEEIAAGIEEKDRLQATRGVWHWGSIIREKTNRAGADTIGLFEKVGAGVGGERFRRSGFSRWLRAEKELKEERAVMARRMRLEHFDPEKSRLGKESEIEFFDDETKKKTKVKFSIREERQRAKEKLGIEDAAGQRMYRTMSFGSLGGTTIRLWRLYHDYNFANPLRGLTTTMTFLGNRADTIKRARFQNEKFLIKDAEKAAEEAWKVHEEAQKAKGAVRVTAKDLEETYKKKIAGDVLDRLTKTDAGAENFAQALVRKSVEKQAKRIAKEVKDVEGNSVLTGEQKAAVLRRIITKNASYLRDIDAMVSEAGMIDTTTAALRITQKGSQAFALGLTGQSLAMLASKFAGLDSVYDHVSLNTLFHGTGAGVDHHVVEPHTSITDTPVSPPGFHKEMGSFVESTMTTTTPEVPVVLPTSPSGAELGEIPPGGAFLDKETIAHHIAESGQKFGEVRHDATEMLNARISKTDSEIHTLEQKIRELQAHARLFPDSKNADMTAVQEHTRAIGALQMEKGESQKDLQALLHYGTTQTYQGPDKDETHERVEEFFKKNGLSDPAHEALRAAEKETDRAQSPHLLEQYVLHKGDSPLKALKELYKQNPDAVARYLGVEKVNAGDVDRLLTRRVVAEYLLEYGREGGAHWNPKAPETWQAHDIFEKATKAWSEHHGGKAPDLNDPKILDSFMSNISRNDFNHILNDRVPNLVHAGDTILLDSHAGYEIVHPGGGDVGHVDTHVGHIGEHVEKTFGLEENPFEGLKWDVVQHPDGHMTEALHLESLFDAYTRHGGEGVFERAIGYDVPDPSTGKLDGDLDMVTFFVDSEKKAHTIFREPGEAKLAFFERLKFLLERGKILKPLQKT